MRRVMLQLILLTSCLLGIPAICNAQVPVQTTTLSFDYTTSDTLCSTTVTQDCVDTFIFAYETAPGVFTDIANVPLSACTPKAGGGVTCTAPVPTVVGEKYKAHTWAAKARTKDGMSSLYSNTLLVQLRPGTPGTVRATP